MKAHRVDRSTLHVFRSPRSVERMRRSEDMERRSVERMRRSENMERRSEDMERRSVDRMRRSEDMETHPRNMKAHPLIIGRQLVFEKPTKVTPTTRTDPPATRRNDRRPTS